MLEELNLSGNHLRNEEVIVVLRGLSINKNLKKIYLADNQFNEDDSVIEAFRGCFNKNKNLGRYDIRYNTFGEKGKSKDLYYRAYHRC
jgi:Ran GTPase-activating protein (RanGAP) involved in mRNA processing and transport